MPKHHVISSNHNLRTGKIEKDKPPKISPNLKKANAAHTRLVKHMYAGHVDKAHAALKDYYEHTTKLIEEHRKP